MTRQAAAFLEGEGQAWLDRNHHKLEPKKDVVIRSVQKAGIVPHRVLEIGCANGWRLLAMERMWGSYVRGIDPSGTGDMRDGCAVVRGAAHDLSYFHTLFDVVIYGFCLYLCDREDLFKIVYEGDRVLEDGGYLIVYDFHDHAPYSTKYKHKDGILSYHMDYAGLWLANPAYSLYRRNIYGRGTGDLVSVTILKKNLANGWPLHD